MAPREKTALRPAQIATVKELKESVGVQAIMGMGAGKTASALTAIAELLEEGTIGAAIVIAPRRVALTTWPEEVTKWAHLQGVDLVVLSGTPKQRARALTGDHDVYVMGIDNLQWLLDFMEKAYPKSDRRWDLLCIDELSRFKSPRGERAKALRRAASDFRAIWGLTGTPRPNSWEDQWMPLMLVSAGEAWGGESFDDWRRARFRPLDYQQHKWEAHSFAVPEIARVVDTWSFAVAPSAETDIPFNAGDDHDIFVDLCGPALRDLDELSKRALVEIGQSGADVRELIAAGDEEVVVALTQAVANSKMEQILQGFIYRDGVTMQTYRPVKLDALEDLIEGNGGENLLVPYWYREELDALFKRFGERPYLGHGVSDRESARTIHAWNEGRIPLLPVHPASAGHGLNLQEGGRRLVWLGPIWSHELYVQTCKRLARPGQAAPVYSHRIRARHWLDDLKVNRVEGKMAEERDFIADRRIIA